MIRGRVLIIVENLPVPFDRRVWLEATTLAKAGYQVSVICPTGKGYEQRRETLEGVDIYRHPLPSEGNGPLGYLREYAAALSAQFRLTLHIALTKGIDAIHACNPPDLIFLVAAPFKAFGVRFLFDHHDLCPELFEAKFDRKGLLHGLMRALERLTFATADVVIATNESYRAVALSRGRKRAQDVFVVRSGPDLSLWPANPVGDPAWRKGRRHLLGYVGVMGEQEGLDLLLEALSGLIVRGGRRDIQTVLIGDGPARAALEAQAVAMGLSDYVTFTGRLPHAALMSALGTADICVNPDKPSALNDKSTMNKIVEYMALSKPIVQFDLSEGRFSAQDASLYAPPGDTAAFGKAIATLLDDPDLRARMGAFGRTRVEQHLAWRHQETHLLAAYTHLFRRKATVACAEAAPQPLLAPPTIVPAPTPKRDWAAE